jgi:hypothetical protein
MSTPINLNQFRKAKAKTDAAKTAAENRAKHGRTKAEKQLEKAKADKLKTTLDAHKRDAED